jgi:hypothetical protein
MGSLEMETAKFLEALKQDILDSPKVWHAADTAVAGGKYYLVKMYQDDIDILDHLATEWRDRSK